MSLEKKQSKKKKVTVNDIAKAVGMSASTVSRALSNHPKISSSTKDAVHKAAKKLGYFAINNGYMQSEQPKTIIILVDHTQIKSAQTFVKAVQDVLEKHDLQVLIKYISNDDATSLKSLQQLSKFDTTGFISLLNDKKLLLQLSEISTEYQIPLVVVNNTNLVPDTTVISPDLYNGMMLIFRHLLRVRALYPVLITNPEFVYSDALNEAFIEVAEAFENKLTYRKIDVQNSYKELKFEIEQILKKHPETDAFITYNYDTALQLHYLLTSKHIKIPEDIKIVSFGDEDGQPYIFPKITSISYSLTEMGLTAAHQILKIIENQTIENKLFITPTKLIIRSSTMGI